MIKSQADHTTSTAFYQAVNVIHGLSERHALDAFARDGANSARVFAPMCRKTDAWELNPEHRQGLQSISKVADVHIGCTYAKAATATQRYGMVVLDAPQGHHADATGQRHHENFEAIRLLPRLVASATLVCLYLNLRPYDSTKLGHHGDDYYSGYNYSQWMLARADFFGTRSPDNVPLGMALLAYDKHLLGLGLPTLSHLVTPHLPDAPGHGVHACWACFEVRSPYA